MKLTEKCPKIAVVQHLDGDYDYTECPCGDCAEDDLRNAAWVAEVSANRDGWIKEAMDEGLTFQECKNSFLASVQVYTREEVLKAAEDGYGWPLGLGFVVEIGEDE